jgi:hypothetical protein
VNDQSKSDARADEVIVPVALSRRTADLLAVLIDPQWGLDSLEDVLGKLADHAQQGIYRSGAWEREWLCSAFGHEWTGRMEPDPDGRAPSHQRPI